MGKRRRIAVVLAALAGLTLAGYLVAVWPSLTRQPVGPPRGELPQGVEGGSEPASGRFVGHPEADIVGRFGLPTHRWRGHFGAPPVSYQRAYPDAVTATYERPAGALYLSYCEERGRLVCFSSEWLPAGWVF
jgi:hypothetical protein